MCSAPKWQDALSEALGQPVIVSKLRRLSPLWAGYGSVSEGFASVGPKDQKLTQRLIVKQVAPPAGAGTSHERKIRSYQVEAAFYTFIAPSVLEYTSCAIPRPYVVNQDNGGKFLFVLSDLREQHPNSASHLNLKQTKVALEWLARFHAFYWEKDSAVDLWPQGSYWYLDTRMEEFNKTAESWRHIKAIAPQVDQKLKQHLVNKQFRTLLHGDFKSENLLFDRDETSCAAYDFQYCGWGYGMRDVVYLFCSSVDERVLRNNEDGLLHHYLTVLLAQLDRQGVACRYSHEVMKQHYELCLLDYVRFLAGWGLWGNVGWLKAKCAALLQAPMAMFK